MLLKEKLISALGCFGIVVYYLISLTFSIAPLIILDFPFIVNLILIGIVMFLPYIGGIANAILWVLALVAAIMGPQDAFAIVYYVMFAINAVRLLSIFMPWLFVRK